MCLFFSVPFLRVGFCFVFLLELASTKQLLTCSRSNEYGDRPWIANSGIKHSGFRKQYTTSLYWSLSTLSTVGYGDITPGTDEEKVLSMIVMIFGSVLYATIIGNIANCASFPSYKQGLRMKIISIGNSTNCRSQYYKQPSPNLTRSGECTSRG